MDESPPIITKTSTYVNKFLCEAQELGVIQKIVVEVDEIGMAANAKSFMPKRDNAREFIKLVRDYSYSNITNKSVVGYLSSEPTNKKFD